MIQEKIFLSGGSGFVGNALLSRLISENAQIVSPVRAYRESISAQVIFPAIDDVFDLSRVLATSQDVGVVIHVAGKAHTTKASLVEFKRVNTLATLELAKVAAAKGVKRFIFLSSIGVNGVHSSKPFSREDEVGPTEDYAISKLEAELGLKQIAADTGMELVIIRPPLVYGANAPGNFGKLAKLVKRSLPLPLGAIHNKRSLVALHNLVDLIVTCIEHSKAANQTFLVSDDLDLSTTELLRMMAKAGGKKPILLPVPMSWLRLVGKLTGKTAVIERLCSNLQVDISHTKQILSWTPPITPEQGIARCFEKEDLC